MARRFSRLSWMVWGAVKTAHRACFDDSIRNTFADSLDLDEALKTGHHQENRWDYLLGHAPSAAVVAVEPHSAKHDEISTVIRKQQAARDHMRMHLRDGARVARWLWIASGKVHFADTEKARRRLDEKGIDFVGTRVCAKHLPCPVVESPDRKRRGTRRKSGIRGSGAKR